MTKTNTKIGNSALAQIDQNKAKHNTAIGFESLNNMKQGNYNTALGSQTMKNSNGNNNFKSNTAIGGKSLQNVKGIFNTAVGYESGNNIIGGSNNILIGNKSKSSNPKSSNEIVIGNDAKGVENSAVIGNSSNISIEPGNNNITTLGTESNKFETTYASKISNGEVTIKLPNQKLKPGMLMLDEDGNLTSGDLKTEIAANSSKGDTIFIEVNAGNIKGINNNPKVFYKFAAYKYNEVTNKKGDLLKNWNGKLDVSKTYVFGRKDNVRVHPFYISNVGYKKKPNKVTITNIVGKGMNYNLGIKGDQRIKLQFNSNFNATDKLYYYCTAHKNMIGEFKLFSSNWNKLDITVVNGSEPKPIKNIIFNLVLDKDVPKGQTVKLSYQTLNKQGIAIEGTHFKSTSGTIIFKAGEDSKQVEVPVLANTVYEESKTVKIRFKDDNRVLTNTDKGYIYSTAEIIDNGPNPANEKYTLTVNNPTVKEADDLVFNLKLNKKALTNISIDYAIVKNQTTLKEYKIVPFLNNDEQNPVVRFNTGEDKAKLTVSTYRDGIYNNKDKKLMLQFTSSNFKNNYKQRATGTVTEGDEDPSKRKYELAMEYILNPTVTEGEDLVFDLFLNSKPLSDVLVNYAVVKNQTTLKYDQYNLPYYKGEYAVLFKKDTSEASLTIPTLKDGKYDNINKKLVLQFTSSNFKSNYKPRLTGTVTEGDTNPADEKYIITRISEPEKSNAPNAVEGFPLIVQLELDRDALTDIDLYVNTENGTAKAGTHYEALKNKKITIKKGEKEKIFSIQTKSDNKYTGKDKKFKVKITGDNLEWEFEEKECIIKEGDNDPSKKIYNLISSSPTVMEGDSGTKDLKFNLDIQEKALKDTKINYETIDSGSNKARKNIDYEYKKGSITIKEGQRKATIVVKVKGDTTYDNNGKNHLVYVKFSGQNINDRTFSGAIIENDESAENYTYNNLKINGPEVTEGNTKMRFTLDLGEKARSKVIINYETLNDESSAEAGEDYVSKSGQLIFNKGEQKSDFEITIKDDSAFEVEEKIVVQFSGKNIGTFSTFGIIKPDNDIDTSQAKPDLTTKETTYNDDTGELSIKLNNTGNRDVIVNNNQQFNSLFEATTNKSNQQSGTPEIKIGNTTYYVSKNDIEYLKIKDHNFSTYFERKDGININSNKGNKHKITLGSAPSGHNFWTVVNNPGLKKDDSIEFKIKASFKKNTTYIFMADDIKYDSVKESNENNNYFVFTPNKTITYEEPDSEYPIISGYNFVEENKDVYVSKMNGNLISLYVQHYPPPDYPEKDIAIKNISPSELKNNWLLVTKENDKFKQYQIVDYDEWGSGDTTEIYSDGYYYNIGTNPKYTGKDTETIYWYKKK